MRRGGKGGGSRGLAEGGGGGPKGFRENVGLFVLAGEVAGEVVAEFVNVNVDEVKDDCKLVVEVVTGPGDWLPGAVTVKVKMKTQII